LLREMASVPVRRHSIVSNDRNALSRIQILTNCVGICPRFGLPQC
jgi:hypothetical protein